MAPGQPYFSIPKIGLIYVKNYLLKKIVGWWGNHIGNTINDIEVVMKKVER